MEMSSTTKEPLEDSGASLSFAMLLLFCEVEDKAGVAIRWGAAATTELRSGSRGPQLSTLSSLRDNWSHRARNTASAS